MSENNDINETMAAAAVLGGEELVLGNGARVFVRLLPLKCFDEFVQALDDSTALAALFTGATREQIENLSPSDAALITERGLELNEAPFSEWPEHLKRTVEKARGICDRIRAAAGGSGSDT